ncbi:hypothetical protein P2318_21045 [Myxococcaceae bacterium GXIMD 01537]
MRAPRSAWELEAAPLVELTDAGGRPGEALELLAGVPLGPESAGWLHAPVPPRAAQEAPAPASEELESLLDGARELLELDDCSGALEVLRRARDLAPGDARARDLETRAERTLLSMLESRLGDMRGVPRQGLQPGDVMWLTLDSHAGFLLSQVDGWVSYDDLFALSGLTRLETARILTRLLDEGVIVSGPPAS